VGGGCLQRLVILVCTKQVRLNPNSLGAVIPRCYVGVSHALVLSVVDSNLDCSILTLCAVQCVVDTECVLLILCMYLYIYTHTYFSAVKHMLNQFVKSP
jgi:hypothetical protein